MKKLIQFLLILAVLSCNELFHEEEISVAEITSLADLEIAVNGLNAQFFNLFTGINGLAFTFFQVYVRGDDLASITQPSASKHKCTPLS